MKHHLIGFTIDTTKILLDREMDHPVVENIRTVVESVDAKGDVRLKDLHVWRVGKQVYACSMTIVTQDLQTTPVVVRERLFQVKEVVHSTIEIHYAPDKPSQVQTS